ncbi:hypothetical protein ACFL6S_36860 [Candidatus Poribacteria bacterium]
MSKLICIILPVILLSGCINSSQDVGSNKIVIILLDFSASFKFLGESVGKAAETVDELRSGDELVVCAIDGSNSGQNILHAKLPKSARAIDPDNQRRVHIMKLKLKQLIRGINTKRVSGNTDLLGPIYAASRLFARASDKQKYLLLFTDLDDTRGQTIPQGSLNLRDVKVMVFFTTPDSIQDDISKRQKWSALFQSAGASFEMLNVNESRSLSPILGPGDTR